MTSRSAASVTDTAIPALLAEPLDHTMLRAAGPPDDAAKAAARSFVGGPAPFVGTIARLLVGQDYDPRAVRAEDFGDKDPGVLRPLMLVDRNAVQARTSIQGGAR